MLSTSTEALLQMCETVLTYSVLKWTTTATTAQCYHFAPICCEIPEGHTWKPLLQMRFLCTHADIGFNWVLMLMEKRKRTKERKRTSQCPTARITRRGLGCCHVLEVKEKWVSSKRASMSSGENEDKMIKERSNPASSSINPPVAVGLGWKHSRSVYGKELKIQGTAFFQPLFLPVVPFANRSATLVSCVSDGS